MLSNSAFLDFLEEAEIYYEAIKMTLDLPPAVVLNSADAGHYATPEAVLGEEAGRIWRQRSEDVTVDDWFDAIHGKVPLLGACPRSVGASECCKNCFFSKLDDAASMDENDVTYEQVICRRFPPSLHLTVDGLKPFSPYVHKNGWCGEWKLLPLLPTK